MLVSSSIKATWYGNSILGKFVVSFTNTTMMVVHKKPGTALLNCCHCGTLTRNVYIINNCHIALVLEMLILSITVTALVVETLVIFCIVPELRDLLDNQHELKLYDCLYASST